MSRARSAGLDLEQIRQETAFPLNQGHGTVYACMLHTMLGWLNMLQTGSLDQDLGGSSLLQRVQPSETNAFTARTLSKGTTPVKEPQDYSATVKSALREMRVGFSIDADMVCENHNFEVSREGTRLGAREFMSERLMWWTMSDPQPFLHGPVDDFASAYFATQWAAVNRSSDAKQNDVLARRLSAVCEDSDERGLATQAIIRLTRRGRNPYSQFINCMGPTLKDWRRSLLELEIDWEEATQCIDAAAGDDEHDSKLKLAFFTFTHRGVSDLIEVWAKRKQELAQFSAESMG